MHAAESSAYQVCLMFSMDKLWMRGRMPMAYIAMAKGSPCVVPSSEIIASPSMNSCTSSDRC